MREPLPIAVPHLGRLRVAAGIARAEWESDRFPKEDRDAEHELDLRRRAAVRRACWSDRPAPTSGGHPASRRASASTRCACGAGCERTSGWTTSERAFDICGPLPEGITVLEASAGTGKTYTIAALAARYVAEGTPLRPAAAGHVHAHGHRRAARPRARAAGQRRARRSPTASASGRRRGRSCSPTGRRTWSRCGATGCCARWRTSTRRRSPPRTASARRCWAGSAWPATSSPDAELVEDVGDLLAEVVDDLYVRRYMNDERRAADQPRRGAADRARDGREPGRADRAARRVGHGLPALRARLAASVREELERRKRALSIITYDDLLTRLRDALRGPRAAPPRSSGCARATASCWSTSSRTPTRSSGRSCERAFGDGGATLVLIGDPKQAIYAFRGADVYSYLEAAEAAAGETRRSRSTGAATRR